MVKKAFLMILIIIVFPLFARTLLLYKGSENGYGYNILVSYVVPSLENAGEEYKLVDIEKDFPNFEEYDLIVSCYYSSSMPEAKRYLKELSNFILNGGRLFVINNLGAFEGTSLEEINAVLNLLGVRFEYNWRTERVIEYEINKNYLLSPPVTPVLKSFDGFEIFSNTTEVVAWAKTSTGKYPVVFYNEQGGMALFDHAFNEKGEPVLDLGKIVSRILLGRPTNRILTLFNDPNILAIFKNAFFEIETTPRKPLIQYKAIVLSNLNTLNDKVMKRYLESGGVVILVGSGPRTVRGKVVVKKDHLDIPMDLSLFETTVNYTEAPETAIPFITVDGTPVSWMMKVGKGSLVFFPKSLNEKLTRGFLFDEFLAASNSLITPIVNSFSIFLDDFPLPTYNLKHEIAKFKDVTFYYKIWWPDLEKIFKDFSVKPITALVTSYMNTPYYVGFSEFLLNTENVEFLKGIINNDGVELGLHGYNHLSPLSKNWDPSELEKSYRALKIFLKHLKEGWTPLSFVAPDNRIDKLGLSVLKKVFPHILVVGTTFLSDDEFSEFKLLNGTLVLPRNVSGFYPLSKLLVQTTSTLLNIGTFNYFVHPDDVFSKDRNPQGLSWDEMKNSMREFLKVVRDYYPWVKNSDSSQTYEVFKEFFENPPSIVYYDDKIKVWLPRNAELPRYFFLKNSSREMNVKGGKILHKSKNFLVLEMTTHEMEITGPTTSF
ncbi:DUF2194 domain-containing protein [Thermotoga sp. KOL6]|uniref:DUF2194 domain-containing protein n=1 Tax=Thermotoga sp. KOL6 TaxID=126741 RepID=UPI000C7840CD|nr:DUF2194 domain-containing protein [Thermotoga sp. KOL6]PLV60325.1 hypothetical protein AS005_03320 [Thermotoga sp. KOL6]